MSDPFAQVVELLRPLPSFSKLVIASGRWMVRRSEVDRPFYCAVVAGQSRLRVPGRETLELQAGDFVLLPAAYDFVTTSVPPPDTKVEADRIEIDRAVFRVGDMSVSPDAKFLIGHCAFEADDARLLVSLLPEIVHVRGHDRLITLVDWIYEETLHPKAGGDFVLSRLLEVLLIEALRAGSDLEAPAGLLRGLADERLAVAIRHMHDDPARAWSVQDLARDAGLSRSVFFERFRQEVGVAPMEYLLNWRMAQAKSLLRDEGQSIGIVARRVGYSSANTFSAAFTRHVGSPPGAFAKADMAG